MLSQKDLDKIRSIFREELTIKGVTIERINKETGAKELKTVDLYIPDWLVGELPNLSGALRGMQETTDNAKNNSIKAFQGMGAVANILSTIEKPLKMIALKE
ncbi:MAG: hypothetical protein ACYS17_16370 [Planctomycetota bacterium]|jgi:hypothetical protein